MSDPARFADQVRSVLDVSRLLAVTTELDPLLMRIAEAATSLLDCERASIFVHDPQTGELWTKVALQRSQIRISACEGIAGHCFATNRLVHVSDPYNDARFDPEPDRRTGFVTRNLLAAPMLDIERQPIGVIEAVNSVSGDFALEDCALLPLLAEQAGVAIQRYRLQAAAVQIVALQHEMELARRVQQAIIPAVCPTVEGFKVGGWVRPSSITGGDIFDAWLLEDGRLALLVADASGHGISAALLVHQARSLARAFSTLRSDPHEILCRVHEQLLQDLKTGWFVTAFFALLSPDGTLEWSSAGHGPAFVRQQDDGVFIQLPPTSPPLGVVREWPLTPPAPLFLGAGGSLVVLTDGLHESLGPADELLGLDRIKSLLDRSQAASADELIGAIRQAADSWRQSGPVIDDQAVLIVHRIAEK